MIHVNASLIKDLRACPRLAHYRHRRHWEPKATAAPLLFGRAYGLAVAAWWNERDALEVFAANWPNPPDAKREHTIEVAGAMLKAHGDYWAPVRTKALSIETEVSVKSVLQEPAGNAQGIVMDGALDIVVQLPEGALVIEVKTMGKWQWDKAGPRLWDTEPQIIGYYVRARERYADRFLGMRTSVSLVDKAGDLYIGEVKPTELQVDAWRRDTLEAATHWATNPQLRNFDNCRAYFRLCEFNPLCLSGAPPEALTLPPSMVEALPRYLED